MSPQHHESDPSMSLASASSSSVITPAIAPIAPAVPSCPPMASRESAAFLELLSQHQRGETLIERMNRKKNSNKKHDDVRKGSDGVKKERRERRQLIQQQYQQSQSHQQHATQTASSSSLVNHSQHASRSRSSVSPSRRQQHRAVAVAFVPVLEHLVKQAATAPQHQQQQSPPQSQPQAKESGGSHDLRRKLSQINATSVSLAQQRHATLAWNSAHRRLLRNNAIADENIRSAQRLNEMQSTFHRQEEEKEFERHQLYRELRSQHHRKRMGLEEKEQTPLIAASAAANNTRMNKYSNQEKRQLYLSLSTPNLLQIHSSSSSLSKSGSIASLNNGSNQHSHQQKDENVEETKVDDDFTNLAASTALMEQTIEHVFFPNEKYSMIRETSTKMIAVKLQPKKKLLQKKGLAKSASVAVLKKANSSQQLQQQQPSPQQPQQQQPHKKPFSLKPLRASLVMNKSASTPVIVPLLQKAIVTVAIVDTTTDTSTATQPTVIEEQVKPVEEEKQQEEQQQETTEDAILGEVHSDTTTKFHDAAPQTTVTRPSSTSATATRVSTAASQPPLSRKTSTRPVSSTKQPTSSSSSSSSHRASISRKSSASTTRAETRPATRPVSSTAPVVATSPPPPAPSVTTTAAFSSSLSTVTSKRSSLKQYKQIDTNDSTTTDATTTTDITSPSQKRANKRVSMRDEVDIVVISHDVQDEPTTPDVTISSSSKRASVGKLNEMDANVTLPTKVTTTELVTSTENAIADAAIPLTSSTSDITATQADDAIPASTVEPAQPTQ